MTLTQHPELAKLLSALASGCSSCLGDNLLGAYVHGSLAAGDFNPDTSDIDFAVVTTAPVLAEEYDALLLLHAELMAKHPHWGPRLEGSFLPLSALQQPVPGGGVFPSFSTGGTFGLDHKGIDGALQRHVLYTCGVAVGGPPPRKWLAPVTPNELRAECQSLLRSWWAPMLEDNRRLHDPEYRAYAVLTMCRMLYTLSCGAVAGKPAAAAWAAATLGADWSAPIEQARAWVPGAAAPDLEATQALIRLTVAQAEQFT
jgi:hypothetical protein